MASLHPLGLVVISTLPHRHGLALMATSMHHRGLALVAAPLHYRGLTLWTPSVLLLGRGTSKLHCFSSAASSALFLCSSMASSFVLVPDLSGGWGLLLLDAPQTTLPWASGHFSRMFLSWGLWPPFPVIVLARKTQSGSSSATCP